MQTSALKSTLRVILFIFLAAAGWDDVRAVDFPETSARDLGNGEFQLAKYGSRAASKMFPVDPGKAWLLEGEFQAESPTELSFGLELFDGDKKAVHGFLFTEASGTATELVTPARKGDTVLMLKDASRWQLKHHKLAVPHIDPAAAGIRGSDLALEARKLKKSNDSFELTLKDPLPCDLVAGTRIALHGGIPPFYAVWRRPIPGGKYSSFRHLIRPGEKFTFDNDHFWPGTRFARVFITAAKGGKVTFRNVKCTPVSGAALAKFEHARTVGGLRLVPFDKCRARAGEDGSLFYDCPGQGGLRHAFAGISVKSAVQIEALVSADSPGMLSLDCHGHRDSGEDFYVIKGAPVIPDGRPHWMIFRPKFPADGTLDRIEFIWRNYNSTRLKIERFRVLDAENLIPGAEALPRRSEILLAYPVGGRRHRLSWDGTRNPGVRIVWEDRDGVVLGETSLPAGEKGITLNVPLLAVTGKMTIGSGGFGRPVLREIPANAPFWRGSWIWTEGGEGPQKSFVWFENEIELPPDAAIDDAAIASAADDHVDIFINGKYAGEGGTHVQSGRLNIAELLRPGRNVVTLKVRNDTSFGGVICDIFVRAGERMRFFSTGPEWRFALGEKKPAKIDRPVTVLGDGSFERWSGQLDCRYLGMRPVLELTGRGKDFFSAKLVYGIVPELPEYLQYSIASASGRRTISLNTRVSHDGGEYRFDFTPPYPIATDGGVLRLDDDRLLLRGDPALAELAPTKNVPGLATARFVKVGGRTKLEMNGQIREAFFWAFNARFQRNYTSRGELMNAANAAGFDNFALVTDFLEIWKGPDKFDFTNLDRKVEQLLSMNPNAVFLLQIGCYMPDWWLEQNPDDVTVRENGKPRHPRQERQALASKKWLRDARIPLKALVEHVKNAPWGDRVWGANVAENTNWEWFWWTGRGEKLYVSGYSKADYASFHAFLRKKYATDAALAEAWGTPGLTFEQARMPSMAYQLRGRIGTLLDAEKDRSLIDWFEFRNLVMAEAVIDLCASLKEFSDGKWLTGAYYGYYVNQCTNVGSHSIHSAGHNGFWEVANSPYVDYIRAPSIYRLRRLGLPEGNQALQDTFLGHGKVVYIECDMRTALREDPKCTDIRISRPATVRQTIDEMNRLFAMMTATGCTYYWYDITRGAYTHPVLTSLLRKQREIYNAMPPVRNLTPVEIAVVGDRDSVYYTQHNNTTDSLLPAISVPLVEEFPRIGAPFRMLSNADLLTGKAPEHRFYVMFTSFMPSKEQRAALLERFERERASVLWLYAPGAFYPDSGPKAEYCADFLGIRMRMDTKKRRPRVKMIKEWGGEIGVSNRALSPWFHPVSGFDEVLGRDDHGEPVLVSVRRNGATHYLSTLPNLPIGVLREMAKRAGVHLYTADTNDPAWIGCDHVFIHTATAGEKRLTPPRGYKLRRILGPLKREELASGEAWCGEAGRTYGFQVVEE